VKGKDIIVGLVQQLIDTYNHDKVLMYLTPEFIELLTSLDKELND
jgi:hypothetical protein